MFNKKLPIISIVLYVLAGILAIYTIWSIVSIQAYIALQQVPFSGNEYSIISFYMSGSGQYAIFAVILFALGWFLQKFSPVSFNVNPELMDEETLLQPETFAQEAEETEQPEDDTVDENKGFEE